MIGSHYLAALRTFLLTLAVVDDLRRSRSSRPSTPATSRSRHEVLSPHSARSVRRGRCSQGSVLVARSRSPRRAGRLVHSSGVHAIVAGVLLGFAVPSMRRSGRVPVRASQNTSNTGGARSSAVDRCSGLRVLAAGVTVGGWTVWLARHASRGRGNPGGFVGGKPLGVLVATYVIARYPGQPGHRPLLVDVLGLSLLAGDGFTVSLLIGELASEGVAPRATRQSRRARRNLTAAALALAIVCEPKQRLSAMVAAEADHTDVPTRASPNVMGETAPMGSVGRCRPDFPAHRVSLYRRRGPVWSV